eukprot:6208810-Prymnesium_polylepis.1
MRHAVDKQQPSSDTADTRVFYAAMKQSDENECARALRRAQSARPRAPAAGRVNCDPAGVSS